MLHLKQKILLILSAMSISHAYAEITYAPLENLAVKHGFLTLNANHTLSLQPATGADNQQWAFVVEKNTGHWSLKNKTNPELCVDAASHTYKSCDVGLRYTTQRNFFLTQKEKDVFLIQNQYRSHLVKPHYDYLAANEQQTGIQYLGLNDTNLSQLKWRYRGKVPKHEYYSGTRKVLLFNVYFKGQKPQNGQNVYDAVFKNKNNVLSLQEYLEISSRGKASITGKFWDNFALDAQPLSSCSSEEVKEKIFIPLEKFAQQKGLSYDHLFVEMPYSPLCKYGAIARVGTTSQGVLSNSLGHQYGVWTHEVGHHLGFEHTKSLTTHRVNDQVVKLNSQSKIADFGFDFSDAMGGGGLALFPISYRLALNWIDESEVPEIVNTGTYTLLPAYSDKKGAKGFRIRYQDGTFLELEYRPEQGQYDRYKPAQTTGKGLIIRKVQPKGAKKILNHIVDTTPLTDSKDSPLMLGKTLIDEVSGYSIQVLSVDPQKGLQFKVSRSAD